jgi:hypothetical protein
LRKRVLLSVQARYSDRFALHYDVLIEKSHGERLRGFCRLTLLISRANSTQTETA